MFLHAFNVRLQVTEDQFQQMYATRSPLQRVCSPAEQVCLAEQPILAYCPGGSSLHHLLVLQSISCLGPHRLRLAIHPFFDGLQAAVIVFLASKAASFVNGASLVVDGGHVHEWANFPTPDEIAAIKA